MVQIDRKSRNLAYDSLTIPFVVARTASLPIGVIRSTFEHARPLEAVRELVAGDRILREAIRTASPSLDAALTAWIDGENARGEDAGIRALAYVNRMASRSTPYGLFAGIGTVALGDRTSLSLSSEKRRTYTRADMGLVMELVDEIEKGPNRKRVGYFANRAVVERGGRLYVTNIRISKYNGARTEQRAVTLKHTAAVAFARAFAREALPYETIARELAERFEAPLEAAEKILDSLIAAGVLLSELVASPIGDPVDYIVACCKRIDPALASRIADAVDSARALDAAGIQGRESTALATVMERFSSLVAKAPDDPIQVDTHAPCEGTLNANVIVDAARLGEYFLRMGRIGTLKAFRDRFVDSYEGTERMVPLLELVDENLGLGSPESLDYGKPPAARDEVLMRIANESFVAGTREIELSDADFAALVPELPPDEHISSAEIGFQVVAQSPEAIDRGEYLVAPSSFLGTMNAGSSLGRFMHLFEEEDRTRLRALAAATQRGGLTAELVYAPPKARSYNVAIRPRRHDVQIDIGVPRVGDGDRIDLDDLWVGLDGNIFFLWSKSRGCRIVPTESHVLNTQAAAPNICRFLSLLANEGRRSMHGFDWGGASGFAALPRIRVGRLVLSLARWQFPAAELGKSVATATAALERWRSAFALPRYVHVRQGDNKLLLDLDSAIAPRLLFDQVPNGARYVELLEALPAPDETWLRSAAGAHTSEFVAALIPRDRAAAARVERLPVPPIEARRRYGPGSEWLYAKIYLPAQAVEDFVVRSLVPAIERFRAERGLDRWFFVRYADTQNHVRLRFRCASESAPARAEFLELAEEWMNVGRIERYCIDTYDPEYERYGGVDGMDPTERFFTFDSDACAAMLPTLPHGSDERVAAAASSFLPWVMEDEEVALLTLDVFGEMRQKLSQPDREALKNINGTAFESATQSNLAHALGGEGGKERLAALFHMHCNRLGLPRIAERRAIALLRSLVVSRRAVRRKPEAALC